MSRLLIRTWAKSDIPAYDYPQTYPYGCHLTRHKALRHPNPKNQLSHAPAIAQFQQ